MIEPLYTPDHCRVAFQLNWSLAIFWREAAAEQQKWLAALQQATERSGVRILEHRFTKANVSQFLVSTQATHAPAQIIRQVKGNLQALVRDTAPKAFRRNYSIQSVGSAHTDAIQAYVARQVDHHRMADPQVHQRLARYQYADPDVDLKEIRQTSHGQFVFNLHLVLVYQDRGVDVREEWLRTNWVMFPRIAAKKGHRLAQVGVAADHMHLALGANISETPESVAMCYMNNLSHAHGMKDVFQDSYYVGTFGRYDLQAVRRALADQSSFRRDQPGGDGEERDGG